MVGHPLDCYNTEKPLKWQADQIIYTDGSVRDTGEPEFYRSCTGVYRPASEVGPSLRLCIDPIGESYGVANTIQRAESVGIQHALAVEHTHHTRVIAMDSLCAMYMISKHLRCPSLNRELKHVGILQSAVQKAAESLRRGQKIQIMQVKFHIPLLYAKEGHNVSRQSASCREGTERPNPLSPSAIPRCTPENAGNEDFAPDHQVNDLRKGMKSLIRPLLATGYANNTVYVQAWKDTHAHILGERSNHFWKSSTIPVITQVLKYRFGQLWNMKMAIRQRRPYLPGWPIPRSDRCPHCHQPGSGGHIMGGCGHRVLESLYISWHDGALRKVLKAITQGQHGSYQKIADIGRDELISDLSIIDKRIPRWLIPDNTLEECNLPAADRHVLRPDILLIEVTHEEQLHYTTQTQPAMLQSTVHFARPRRSTVNGQRSPTTAAAAARPRKRVVRLLEGGYTSDKTISGKDRGEMRTAQDALGSLKTQRI